MESPERVGGGEGGEWPTCQMAKQEEYVGGITALAKSEGLRSKWNYQGGLSPKSEQVSTLVEKRGTPAVYWISLLRRKIDGQSGYNAKWMAKLDEEESWNGNL